MSYNNIYILHGVLTIQSLVSFPRHIFDALYFLHPPGSPLPSGNHCTVICVCEFILCVHLLLSVLYPTSEWNRMVLICFCLPYFTYYILSKCIHVVADGKFHHFYGRVIFHCLYVPPLIFSVIRWRTLGLFPSLAYCEQCCREYGGAYIFGNNCFQFFR